MAFGVVGCRSYGLSELWVVGVMGRRNRDLTPLKMGPRLIGHSTITPTKIIGPCELVK